MSILLDAVTRQAQQSQQDPSLTSCSIPTAFTKPDFVYSRVILLGLLLMMSVGLAWALNQYRLSLTHNTQTELVNTKIQLSSNDLSAQKADTGIRLAGKVALPIAQEPPSQVEYQYRNAKLTSSTPAKPVTMTSKAQRLPDASDIRQQKSLAAVTADAEHHQKKASLASLAYQVNSAANEVGLSEHASKVAPVHNGSGVNDTTSTPKKLDNTKLMASLRAALSQVERERELSAGNQLKVNADSPAVKYPTYAELPAAVQLKVPRFKIKAHVYSNLSKERWLNVDGAELQEGGMIKGALKIIEIRPNDVVLEIDQQKFKVPAV